MQGDTTAQYNLACLSYTGTVKGFFGYFIVIFVLLISIIFKVSPVFIVLISAFSGIANAIFLKGGMIK